MRNKLPAPDELIAPYRVTGKKKFRLKNHDPADTQGLSLKAEARAYLDESVKKMTDMQAKLYAQESWAVLLIFQALDAGGKDSVIRHVMSGVNPQGCRVSSFKQPSAEDLSHDYLWRASKQLPARGQIGIFNRSYYEEVLVARVHRQILDRQRIPPSLITKRVWKERFSDMRQYEDYLGRNGIAIRKFFLNVSREEQRRRFLSRLDEPEKNWKFSESDVREREHWDDYMEAYEDMIDHTATEDAPWFVVPADQKWFTRMVVASAVVETLSSLKLSFPKVEDVRRKELEEARTLLVNERTERTTREEAV
jgi:PPK2 family polyphosphate:nucleotide phosphotransferase